MKISEMPILTELNVDTYVPVVDLTEADPKQQNKRANKSVFRGPRGEQGEKGADGTNGIDGEKGDKGDPGTPGLSAYEIALADGFVGTESEWLASLRPDTVIINDMGEALDGDSNYVVTMGDHQAILRDSTGDLNHVLLNAASVTDSIELHFQPITILTPNTQPTEPHPGITLKGDLVDAFIQVSEGEEFAGIHLPTDATLTATVTQSAITALRITGDYKLVIAHMDAGGDTGPVQPEDTGPIPPELILEFNGTSSNRAFSIPNATSLTIHRSDTNETKTLTGTSSVSISISNIPKMGTLTIKDVVLGDNYNDLGTLDLSNQDNLVAIHSYGDLPFTRLNHRGCSNLTSVPNKIPSTVTNLGACFNGCSNFNDSSVEDWDTSNVTNMSGMFYYVRNFNGDISSWDTSNVTDMGTMFYGANSFNGDISGWDVSNVTDMWNMFNNASSFDQDLSGWCVSNISTKPSGFDTGTTNWVKEGRLPVWGTCPRGEDQN